MAPLRPCDPRLEYGIFRQGNLDWQADCECDVRPKPHAFIRNVLNPPKTDIGCPFHTGCAANGHDPQFTPAVRHRIVSMIMRRSRSLLILFHCRTPLPGRRRSEEHTSELQSLMRI